jgi:hypothetical protein
MIEQRYRWRAIALTILAFALTIGIIREIWLSH